MLEQGEERLRAEKKHKPRQGAEDGRSGAGQQEQEADSWHRVHVTRRPEKTQMSFPRQCLGPVQGKPSNKLPPRERIRICNRKSLYKTPLGRSAPGSGCFNSLTPFLGVFFIPPAGNTARGRHSRVQSPTGPWAGRALSPSPPPGLWGSASASWNRRSLDLLPAAPKVYRPPFFTISSYSLAIIPRMRR